jgi:imidazolonepropionase-like amidohydrolase
VSGAWIVPGLIDAHVHFSQTGWADGRPDSFDVRDRYPYEKAESDLAAHPERFLRADLCSGVTSVFDNGGYMWTVEMARRERENPGGPRVAAAGPLLATIDFWLGLPAEKQFIPRTRITRSRRGIRGTRGRSENLVHRDSRPDRKPPRRPRSRSRGAGLVPLIVHAVALAELSGARADLACSCTAGDLAMDDEFCGWRDRTIYCRR